MARIEMIKGQLVGKRVYSAGLIYQVDDDTANAWVDEGIAKVPEGDVPQPGKPKSPAKKKTSKKKTTRKG